MRTTRLRQRIKKYLEQVGEAHTHQIQEYLNSTMRHGTTPQQLGNVLAKDKDIVKVTTTRTSGTLSGGYQICVWALAPAPAPAPAPADE